MVTDITNKYKLSVFGLGKLGSPLAICLASKGFKVIGYDVDKSKVKSLKESIIPIYEPGLQDLLDKSKQNLTFSDDYTSSILNSDITFVIVPTPSTNAGTFSLELVLKACEQIGEALQKKNSYHIIVIVSTIMPCSMDKNIKPLLEKASGKIAGKDFGLCYNPEFVALGSTINDFLKPDFVLIGESDLYSGDTLESLYKVVCESNPKIARMNFVNAEITKISVNSYITTKITFANTLARICEKLPGANVDAVTKALGYDSRIGPKYLKGAISYGGPCFPRDNIALTMFAKELNINADIAEATDRFNRAQIKWLAQLVCSKLPEKGTVGILGITYKPNSNVIEEAPGYLLAHELASNKIPVILYDPLLHDNFDDILNKKIAKSIDDCINADVIVVITPHADFSKISLEQLTNKEKLKVIIDCWRILNHLVSNKNISYIPLGIGL